MKRLLMFFAVCLMAMSVQATTVWWVHFFSENAVVHSKDGTLSITEYAENVLGDSLYNVAYMVKDVARGAYLDFLLRFEDGDELWDVNFVDGGGASPYIRYQQVSIDAEVDLIPKPDDPNKNLPIEDWSTLSRDWSDELMVELHLYDENTESFTRFAVSDIFTLADIRKGLSGQGTITPPANPTIFVDFYTDDYVPPVPEPSIGILFAFGLAALLARRKIC